MENPGSKFEFCVSMSDLLVCFDLLTYVSSFWELSTLIDVIKRISLDTGVILSAYSNLTDPNYEVQLVNV